MKGHKTEFSMKILLRINIRFTNNLVYDSAPIYCRSLLKFPTLLSMHALQRRFVGWRTRLKKPRFYWISAAAQANFATTSISQSALSQKTALISPKEKNSGCFNPINMGPGIRFTMPNISLTKRHRKMFSNAQFIK